MPRDREPVDVFLAAAVAGALSGAPSTIHALASGHDPLEASLAAGSILVPPDSPPWRLLGAAVVVHSALSLGWTTLFALALPRRATVAWGALAGLGVAALDLGLLARPFPRVRALRLGPQVADHLAFGALVGLVLARRGPVGAAAGR